VSTEAGFDEIYRAAEFSRPRTAIPSPRSPRCCKASVSARFRPRSKKNSVLLALDAAGVKIEEIIEDAVKRDRALDGFERVQQKSLDQLEARTAQDNLQIQAELDRLTQEHRPVSRPTTTK